MYCTYFGPNSCIFQIDSFRFLWIKIKISIKCKGTKVVQKSSKRNYEILWTIAAWVYSSPTDSAIYCNFLCCGESRFFKLLMPKYSTIFSAADTAVTPNFQNCVYHIQQIILKIFTKTKSSFVTLRSEYTQPWYCACCSNVCFDRWRRTFFITWVAAKNTRLYCEAFEVEKQRWKQRAYSQRSGCSLSRYPGTFLYEDFSVSVSDQLKLGYSAKSSVGTGKLVRNWFVEKHSERIARVLRCFGMFVLNFLINKQLQF